MNTQRLVKLVVQSLEAIKKPYRQPYENLLYERILCYEFYHQFRSRIGDFCFVLHGELEKGYRNVEEVPDFVFHAPGTDEKNVAVMEFRSTKYSINVLNGVLTKLCRFRSSPFNYQTGVFVLFGPKGDVTHKHSNLSKPNERCDVELLAFAYDIQSGKVIKTKSL